MIRLLVGFFLIAQGIMIYFGVILLSEFLMPDLLSNLGTKGFVGVGIVTLLIQFISIKRYTEPDFTEDELEESEGE